MIPSSSPFHPLDIFQKENNPPLSQSNPENPQDHSQLYLPDQNFDELSEQGLRKKQGENVQTIIKKKYTPKPALELWKAYMEVITEHKLIFLTWRRRSNYDFAKSVAEICNLKPSSVKSWNQTQKKNYFLQGGIDLLYAVKKVIGEYIQMKQIVDEETIKTFEKLKQLIEERQWLTKQLKQDNKDMANIVEEIKQIKEAKPEIAQNQVYSQLDEFGILNNDDQLENASYLSPR